MAEHPNAALYRRIMEAFERGETEQFGEVLADDVVWWQIGSDEPLRGKEAVLGSMAILDQIEFDVELHDVLATDDHLVGLVTATVNVGDQSFTYRTAEIAHVEDGKVTERWAFSDDTERINRFFSQFEGAE